MHWLKSEASLAALSMPGRPTGLAESNLFKSLQLFALLVQIHQRAWRGDVVGDCAYVPV